MTTFEWNKRYSNAKKYLSGGKYFFGGFNETNRKLCKNCHRPRGEHLGEKGECPTEVDL